MAHPLLLIHSPLLGPSSWAEVATLARRHGRNTAVPDLTGVAATEPPRWSVFVDAAVEAADSLDTPVTIVGHSGAGVILPTIAHSLGDRCGCTIFVDAVVPPPTGAHRTPPRLKEMLDQHTVDGILRPWLEWWADDVVRELVPDADVRDRLRSDMPRLARSFYDEDVPVPDGWSARANAYLRLSVAYAEDRREAVDRDWPTMSIDADHLSILTRPGEVLTALAGLEDGVERSLDRERPA